MNSGREVEMSTTLVLRERFLKVGFRVFSSSGPGRCTSLMGRSIIFC